MAYINFLTLLLISVYSDTEFLLCKLTQFREKCSKHNFSLNKIKMQIYFQAENLLVSICNLVPQSLDLSSSRIQLRVQCSDHLQ